LIRSDWLWLWI